MHVLKRAHCAKIFWSSASHSSAYWTWIIEQPRPSKTKFPLELQYISILLSRWHFLGQIEIWLIFGMQTRVNFLIEYCSITEGLKRIESRWSTTLKVVWKVTLSWKFFINASVRFYIFLGVLNFGFFKEFCSFQKLERGLRKSLSSSLPVTMLNRARVVRVHFLHKPSKAERRPNLVNHHK